MQHYSRKTIRNITIIFLCILVQSVSAETLLSFGLYTSDKPTLLVKKFRPILNTLEKSMSDSLKTKITIKISITNSYEKGILALANSEVDFSRLGPASYIKAREQNPNISLLAMESKKGKKYFEGVICVHENSIIKSIPDLKGKSFAFGDKRSTIGRYLSQQHLYQNGIKAHQLSSYKYLGRHDKVGYAVAKQEFDAGALKKSTFIKLTKKGQALKILAHFDNITKPWVAREGLNKKIFNALKNALLNIKNKEILKVLKKDGFLSANTDDYKVIKQAMDDNKMFFKK